MTRHRRMQKLWMKLTELQGQYVRQLVRHQPTAETQRQITLVRADIMKLEAREEKDRRRTAA